MGRHVLPYSTLIVVVKRQNYPPLHFIPASNPKPPSQTKLDLASPIATPLGERKPTRVVVNPMAGDHGHGHGEAHGDFRSKVWSMSGGPYCRPKHWRRNTAIAMAGIFLICIPIAMKSAELEQRPHHPVRPIPSQLWCKNFGNKDY